MDIFALQILFYSSRSEVKKKYIDTNQFLAQTDRFVSLDLNVSS